MTQLQSITEAHQTLSDPTQSTNSRELALHTLAKTPTPDHLLRLSQALTDEEFGVRWTAAVLLADLGSLALKPLLQTLVSEHESAWLREGAHHVFYYSRSASVRQQTEALQQALRCPAAEVATASAAVKLLQTLP